MFECRPITARVRFALEIGLRAPDDLRSMAPHEVRLNDLEHVSRPQRASTILAAVARDIHFWVPVIVLVVGLVLLRWVS